MNRPLNDLPEGLLPALREVLPEFTLVGSFARDYRVHTVAGLPRVARTLDVDISILVPSIAEYRRRLRHFDGPHGTGIRFLVNGVSVDVIPYGPDVAPGGITETVDGITLDVTGMAEAAEDAELVHTPDSIVRVPTLSSMIGLKIVAWNYRSANTTKDARDLGPLIAATYHGPAGDALWSESEAGDKWDYDDVLMGPYLAGQQLNATWRNESLNRLIQILDQTGLATLSTQISRLHRTSIGLVADQLAALKAGIASKSPGLLP